MDLGLDQEEKVHLFFLGTKLGLDSEEWGGLYHMQRLGLSLKF